MKEIMEVLRVQRHDFLNHLQVISGLLQLKKYDRALEYINQISQDMRLDSHITRLENPELGLTLMVLRNQAAHRGISLEISVDDFPSVVTKSDFNTTLKDMVDLLLQESPQQQNSRCQLRLTNHDTCPKLEIQMDTKLSPEGIKELDNLSSRLAPVGGQITWQEASESPLLTINLVFNCN